MRAANALAFTPFDFVDDGNPCVVPGGTTRRAESGSPNGWVRGRGIPVPKSGRKRPRICASEICASVVPVASDGEVTACGGDADAESGDKVNERKEREQDECRRTGAGHYDELNQEDDEDYG